MRIFITGGTGFIGKHLVRALLAQGHTLIVTGTRQSESTSSPENFRYIVADTTRAGDWQKSAADADILVNLAGRSIFKRWTPACKRLLYDSRILTTRHLVASIPEGKKTTLVSASAVGFYGDGGEDILTETIGPGEDFLARLSRDWEIEALLAEKKGVRVVVPRFGVVLGKDGGALPKMLLPFRFFVGGPIGTGAQWVSWIHIRDLTEALMYILNDARYRGVYNFTAPEPVRYRDFASALGRMVGRPSFVRTPAFMIRLAMGEMGRALLASQRTVPDRLLEAGYGFQFNDIRSAYLDLIRSESGRNCDR